MAFTMHERPDSRDVSVGVSSGTQLMLYNLKATEGDVGDEVAAYAYVLANTPGLLNGLIRRNVKMEQVEGRTDRWLVDVEYGRTGVDGTEDPVGSTSSDPAATAPSQAGSEGDTPSDGALGAGYSFNISAVTTHITHSRRQMARVKRGANVSTGTITLTGVANVVVVAGVEAAPDDVGKTVWITSPPAGWYAGGYKILAVTPGASGVGTWTLDRAPARDSATGACPWFEKPQADDYMGTINPADKEIKGTDIYQPQFTLTRTVSVYGLSMAHLNIFYRITAKKNDRPWYGFASGDVLYLGATGSHSEKGRYSVTHSFAVSPSEVDIAVVPGELTLPHKRGFDYVWISYEERDVNMRQLTRPRAIYVEEVYSSDDFTELGIGR